MLSITLIPILCVALGGAIGSIVRYGMVQLVMHMHPQPFPLGTMLVNIIGSCIIGLMMAKYATADSEAGRLFVVTGLLGGFTTFSAFSWDALQLLQRGAFASAALYVVGSVLISLFAVFIGYKLG